MNYKTKDSAIAKFICQPLNRESLCRQLLPQKPQAIVTPDTNDITSIQKTADWLLDKKILPKRVDVASVVCPTVNSQ